MNLSIQNVLRRMAVRLSAIYCLPVLPLLTYGESGPYSYRENLARGFRHVREAIKTGDLG